MEQRYQAVLEVVVHGAAVAEVARRYGVSRASVHTWIRRYEIGSVAGLADRSHRPAHHPRQLASDLEALICEMRRAHPKWGPRRLVHELGRRGIEQAVVSRSTVYRVLVRNHLVDAKARKRGREDFKRWERDSPMQLWQIDIMEPVRLVGGKEAKLVSGVDDHSRFCVIAKVVPRATGRAVCAALAEALRAYGVPEEILSDNGKQFTGRFGPPPHAEVLFERILRENGIKQRFTAIRSPTTTGKVERWHQTIQEELLNDAAAFVDLDEAQAAVDRWCTEYNTERPHQSLDMATPASRFRSIPAQEREALPLVLPPQLKQVPASVAVDVPTEPMEGRRVPPPAVVRRGGEFDAVEIERLVPPSGNLSVCNQQFWLGEKRVGKTVVIWIDTKQVFLSIDGRRIKELKSRLSAADLAKLRACGARPAGPPPPRPAERGIARGVAVEVDRTVNKGGTVGIAREWVGVGMAYAGQRVTLRLEGDLVHVVADGVLVKTVPSPLSPEKRARLTTARLAGAPPRVNMGPTRVYRTVSERGDIRIAGERMKVGSPHARTMVMVEVDDRTFRVLNEAGEVLKVIPRRKAEEVTRTKAYEKTR